MNEGIFLENIIILLSIINKYYEVQNNLINRIKFLKLNESIFQRTIIIILKISY